MKDEPDQPEDTEAAVAAQDGAAASSSVLDEMLEEPPRQLLAPSGVSTNLVGEVIDDEHPSLRGRVRVRWVDLEGQTFEKWLPTLQGLPVRVADRVLMITAANWPEPVVTGVIDGFARRPERPRTSAAMLELKRDEVVRVQSAAGEGLVEVFEEDSGPVIRLLKDDVDLDLQGKLRVRAQSIEFEAKQGEARIQASDDVVVKGEVIHLN
jgi:hypothetical protein